MKKSLMTIVASFIGMLSVVLFVRYGPVLSEQVAIFTVFLFIVFACMTVVATTCFLTTVLNFVVKK